jgi:hypothetical protein
VQINALCQYDVSKVNKKEQGCYIIIRKEHFQLCIN